VRDGKKIELPSRENDPVRYLSVAHSVPEPLAARFVAAWGLERADSVLAALDTPPPVTVRVNTLKISRDELLARLPDTARKTRFAPNGIVLDSAAALAPLLEDGLCFVQDEASQICVEAAAAAPHMRVLDLCAAPGSKSFGMAINMQNTGSVMSFDLHQNKVSLIKKGAERLGITTLLADAGDARRAHERALGSFDVVLADVPCSGYGVIAKKPDIRYKDITLAAGLPPVQRAILDAAAACVAVGGRLVYSTCTLLPEENSEVVESFLREHAAFSLAPFAVGDCHADGMLTLFPDTHGTDGFFVAVMQRNKD